MDTGGGDGGVDNRDSNDVSAVGAAVAIAVTTLPDSNPLRAAVLACSIRNAINSRNTGGGRRGASSGLRWQPGMASRRNSTGAPRTASTAATMPPQGLRGGTCASRVHENLAGRVQSRALVRPSLFLAVVARMAQSVLYSAPPSGSNGSGCVSSCSDCANLSARLVSCDSCAVLCATCDARTHAHERTLDHVRHDLATGIDLHPGVFVDHAGAHYDHGVNMDFTPWFGCRRCGVSNWIQEWEPSPIAPPPTRRTHGGS